MQPPTGLSGLVSIEGTGPLLPFPNTHSFLLFRISRNPKFVHLSLPIWFPRSNQGHFQNRQLTASCSCSPLWDPTAQVKTQTWARPRGAKPSVGITLPRYTILSQFSGPQVLPHSRAFTCSSFCRSTLPRSLPDWPPFHVRPR